MGANLEAARLAPLQAPRSLVEDAADRIREQILSGGFRQGQRLVETRIAEQLSVSRGPVREAFKLLRAEGLVQEEPRRGTFVVSLSSRDVHEIYGLRAAIEGRAALIVAGRGDPDDLAELRRLLEALEAAVADPAGDSVLQCDLAFHDGLCRLSGNTRLHEVFVRYVPVLRTMLRLDERVYPSLEEIAEQHRRLVATIEAGDPAAAARAVAEHCDQAGELICAYLEGLPER